LAAIEDPDPVIFLEPIRLYRAIKEEVPDDWFTVPLGEARIETHGSDVTIITWGAMTREARQAVTALEAEGVAAELIDLRSLVPLDEEAIVASVERTGRAVVIHEAPRTGGFGAEVAAIIQERCLYALTAPIQRVTGWDTVFPLKRSEHHYLPSVGRILTAVRRTMEV
jgi:pyruvate dehydrogenase E1 component beta subunit